MILSSIFGSGDTQEKGLADAFSADEFDQVLEDVQFQRCEVESTQYKGEPKFHSWFKQHLGQTIEENVIAPIRQITGLGLPPEFYTQNVAECRVPASPLTMLVAWSKGMHVTKWNGLISAFQ